MVYCKLLSSLENRKNQSCIDVGTAAQNTKTWHLTMPTIVDISAGMKMQKTFTKTGVVMNSISITYSKDTIPYIQITPYGLVLNRNYLGYIDNDFLKGILYSEGYYNVSDSLILAIKGYSDIDNQEENVTVMFAVE